MVLEQHLKDQKSAAVCMITVVGDAAHRRPARDVSGQDDHICLG